MKLTTESKKKKWKIFLEISWGSVFTYPWERFLKSDIAVMELMIFWHLHYYYFRYCYNYHHYNYRYYYFIITITINIVIITNIIVSIIIIIIIITIFIILLILLLPCYLILLIFIITFWYVDPFGQKEVLLVGFKPWDVESCRSKLPLELISMTPLYNPVLSA